METSSLVQSNSRGFLTVNRLSLPIRCNTRQTSLSETLAVSPWERVPTFRRNIALLLNLTAMALLLLFSSSWWPQVWLWDLVFLLVILSVNITDHLCKQYRPSLTCPSLQTLLLFSNISQVQAFCWYWFRRCECLQSSRFQTFFTLLLLSSQTTQRNLCFTWHSFPIYSYLPL